MKRYWIDANSIIWANRKLFPYDSVRSYWDWLASKIEEGSVVTHKRVFAEIVKGLSLDKPDPIAAWMKARKCLSVSYGDTPESSEMVGQISSHVLNKYGFATANAFLRGADAHLIARAYVEHEPLITQESVAKELRIPRVCKHFGVACMDLPDMNIALGMKLK